MVSMSDRRSVLFVCPHGAAKSRIAAAWFDGLRLGGWAASSAGLEPAPQISSHPVRLLANSAVRELLDESLPRPMSAVPDADLVVAIDCPADTAAGVRWTLAHQEFDELMCDEIRDRVHVLAAMLSARQPS